MTICNNPAELFEEIQIALNIALENNVAMGVKQVMQQEVENVVYGAGIPKIYIRRNLMGGSLGDKMAKVCYIVQDIGRPHDMGSADCEQWADMLMDVFEEPQ